MMADSVEEMPNDNWPGELRKVLTEYFQADDLRQLCFDWGGIDYDDDLPGDTRSTKIIKLISLVSSSGRELEFINLCEKQRPNVSWDDLRKKVAQDQEKGSESLVKEGTAQRRTKKMPAWVPVTVVVAAVAIVAIGLIVLLQNRGAGGELTATNDEDFRLARMPGMMGTILYTANVNGDLSLVSSAADGSKAPKVVADHNASSALWSNDGGNIVFQRVEGGTTNIFTANRDGNYQTKVTDVPASKYARTPSWFPTQDLIFFESNVTGNTEIYHIPNPPEDIQASAAKVTETAEGDSSSPSLSPDSRYLAFSSNREGNWDIYVMDLNKEDEWVQLTDTPDTDEYPVWSPDGRRLAFSSNRDGHFEIYVMNADGSGQQKVSSTPANKWSRLPAWSPDGQKIIFVSNQEDTLGSFYGDLFLVDVESKVQNQLTFGGRIWTWRPSWAGN